ncbi:MAG: signal peptidase II [Bacteroidales bacterium]|nr:signal peptidase II [Bacteroidales bacterium]
MKISKGVRLLILGTILVVIDQVIKVLVKTHMSLGESIPVLGNWFQLLYIENRGMAFGMAFGGDVGKLLLTIFRLVLFGVLCWWIAKLCKRENPVPTGVLVGLTLITAGAMGNIVDSVLYGVIWGYAPLMFGQVVDMFYFPLWTWPDWVPWLGGHIFFEPIFNFADSCVTVGAFYLILFQWKFFARDDSKEASKK